MNWFPASINVSLKGHLAKHFNLWQNRTQLSLSHNDSLTQKELVQFFFQGQGIDVSFFYWFKFIKLLRLSLSRYLPNIFTQLLQEENKTSMTTLYTCKNNGAKLYQLPGQLHILDLGLDKDYPSLPKLHSAATSELINQLFTSMARASNSLTLIVVIIKDDSLNN